MQPGICIFRFAGFSLDPQRRVLLAEQGPVQITARTFDLLEYLVRRAGETVPNEDILRAVWRGVNVGDNNLSVQISTLRRLLGSDAMLIVNVPGQGYRFTAAVTQEVLEPGGLGNAPPDNGATLAGHAPADAPIVGAPEFAARPPQSRIIKRRRAAAVLVGVVVLLVAVIGLRDLGQRAGPAPPATQSRGARVAVRPFEVIGSAPALQELAASLSDTLLGLLTANDLPTLSPQDAAALAAPGSEARIRELDVGLMFSGTIRAAGDGTAVRVRLEDPIHHAVLWTAEISAPADQFEPLQAKVGARAIAVLNCSTLALRPGGLAEPAVLALYLHACDIFEDKLVSAYEAQSFDLLTDTLRQVIMRAPTYADGHAALAKFEAFFASSLPKDQQAAIRTEATAHIQAALAIDPNDRDAYVARSLLAPSSDFEAREAPLRRALTIDPAWPYANGFLGELLLDLGRLSEATAFLTRAAAVNPESLDWAGEVPAILARTGHFDNADQRLTRLRQLWPTAFTPFFYGIISLLDQHRWTDALTMLDHGGSFVGDAGVIARYRAIATAGKLGDAEAVAQVAQLLMHEVTEDSLWDVIEGLCLLGRVDDAFDVARSNVAVMISDDYQSILFEPAAAPMRRDQRFMPLAASLGLAAFWLKTGAWPDFCSEPGLPYVCRDAAAKAVGTAASLQH